MERQLAMIAASTWMPGRGRAPMRRLASFTLVELLVVMAIGAIILGIAIPAMTSVVQGNNISAAGQQVADQVNLARQIASAKNTTVEMRIFKLSGASTSGYTQLQLGTNSPPPTSTWIALIHAVILPGNTAISENTTLSPAFAYTNPPPTMPTTGYGAVSGAKYYAYEFRPSGIMYPALSLANYSMAIVPAQYASTTYSTLGTPIKNYVVVQINPMTSTPLVYRP